jgi:hypothetical protein
MFAILYSLGMFFVDLFKSRSRLEAVPPSTMRLRPTAAGLDDLALPSLLGVTQVVQPETINPQKALTALNTLGDRVVPDSAQVLQSLVERDYVCVLGVEIKQTLFMRRD